MAIVAESIISTPSLSLVMAWRYPLYVDPKVCMPLRAHRLIVLLACTCAIFWPGAFIFGFPGILRQHWEQIFNAGAGAVGATVFYMIAGATCFMYFSGRLQEKYDPGRLVAIGSVICGGATFWMSWAGSITEVNCWAFSVGASSAFVYLPGLTVVQRWYPERRGLVAGLFNMAFGISAAVMSPVFALFLSTWGYEKMTMAAGGAAMVLGLIASMMVKFPRVERSSMASNVRSKPINRSVKEALKSREFWYLWFTWVFAGAAGASMLVLATGFGLSRSMSLTHAVFLLTSFNLTNGIGRLISGYYSDRIGRSQMMALSFLCAGLAYIIMPHAEGLWFWGMLSAVIGFAFGTLFAVSGPLAGDCFGMLHFGAIFGLIFTAYGFVAGPLGPWLSGIILDATHGNYELVFTLLGSMYLVATGLILMIQPWRECRLY
jgi:OFA family oxalate/formate antiporter-like MFS transporter